MINVETLKFLTILNELAELTEGGFDDFSNANEANWGTKVFYDSRKSEDGRFPVVMDACIIDDPKCSHHDIICYYDSDQNEFTVNAVRDEYDDTYLIQVDFMYSKKKIGIQNGDWYFA